MNVFWWKNKSFQIQFGGVEETPDIEETLNFWRSNNNKEVSEELRGNESIQSVLREVREKLQGRRCRWGVFPEEFDEILICTAPWNTCGVDSVYLFSIKKCPCIKKAV